MAKRVIPLSKEKVKKSLLLQEIKEKRMAAARKIFKGSENEEASEENHDFTLISDSEVSLHHLNL